MHSLFLREVSIDWDTVSNYTQHIAALHSFDRLAFQKQITSFVRENGSGKSMLLEAIAIAYSFNSEGSTKNYRFYTKDTCSPLYEGIHLGRGFCQPSCSYFLWVESFCSLVTKAEEYASIYQGRGPHPCSHGESLLSSVQSFRSIGLLSLDELEAALSPQHQLALLIQLSTIAWEGSQFLIVTSSLILLSIPNTQILSLDDGIIEGTTYEQTAFYQITEMSMNNREYIFDKLLQENEKQKTMNIKQATTTQQRRY